MANKSAIESVIKDFTETYVSLLKNCEMFENSIVDDTINAWNRFCEDERLGRGKIYNIYDKNDVIAAIEIGLDSKAIAKIVKNNEDEDFLIYFYDDGGHNFIQINNFNVLRERVIGMIEEIAPYVIFYPQVKEYYALYSRYTYQTFDEIMR